MKNDPYDLLATIDSKHTANWIDRQCLLGTD